MKKRVLLCSPYHSAFTWPIQKALIKLGYEVIMYDYQKGNALSRILGLIINRLNFSKKIFTKNIQNYIQKQIINLVSYYKPKLVFIIKGENISINTLKQLKKIPIKIINWYPDWLIKWDWALIHAPYYDYFFSMCNDLTQKVKTINNKSKFLLPATNPDKTINNNRKYNISFIGQRTDRREKYFEHIVDLGLNIWGYDRWKHSSLKEIYHSHVTQKKCLDILRNSKITVNILTGDNSFEPKAINVRTFEALGTGSMLLIQDNPLLYKYFQPGKDFVTFKTPRDLREKAKYYLINEKKRQEIANHGWRTIKSKHTYEIRLHEILKHVNF